MKHYGDITKIDGAKVEPVWVVCGGSPCQDLSVAGKRKGLQHSALGDGETTRSGLFMEQIRIIKEMRNESKKRFTDSGADVDFRLVRPRYMVWENVPGALSSNGCEDFKAVLEETAKVADENAVIPGPPKGKWSNAGCIMADGWSIAWRIHDGQFWGKSILSPDGKVVKRGTPQRRRRISLVADFGGQTAPEILFERARLSGNPESCGTPRETVTTDLKGCTDEASSYTLKVRGGAEFDRYGKRAGKGALVQTELSGTLGVSQDQTLITKCLNSWDVQSKHIQPEEGKAESLYSGECRGGGGESYVMQKQNPIAFEPGIASRCGGHIYEDGKAGTVRANAGDNQQAIAYGISAYDSNSMKSKNPNSGIYEAETSRTLDLNGGSPACNQGGMAVVQGADLYNGAITGDKAASLTASGGNSASHSGPSVICLEGNGQRDSHKGDGFKESDTMYTLNTVEQHAVAYRKQAHPQNSEEGQGWEETEKHDTLNAFDNTESRVPTVVVNKKQTVYDWHRQDTRMTELPDVCVTAAAGWGGGGNNMPYVLEETKKEPILLESNQNHATVQTDGVSTTLPASMGEGGGYVPMVTDKDTYQKTTGALCASGYDKLGTQEAMNGMFVVESTNWDGSQVSPTLTKNNAGGSQRMPDKDNFNAVVQSMEVFHCTTEEDKVQTLKARDYKDPQCVAYGLDRASYNQGKNAKFDFSVEKEKIGPKTAVGPGAVCSYQNVTETICGRISAGTSNQIANDDMLVANTTIVRRLTPLECERLQGFPDFWTNIGDWTDTKGKVHKDADSNKYKALGNSICLPFWKWMAKRMCDELRAEGVTDLTMASLFDGIGGFPLSFQEAGCKPVWASEIEEFPIAVTKLRFPE